jgi:crotonobetainyl-CoA:carnitine CoA-transferase CaiB-like acyl-CoA transferase
LMKKPLEGVTVLDVTQSVAGPYCTMLLGDLGADVTKIERPEAGDDTRSWGPPYWNEESTTFLSLNRNKRSIALDMKHEEGQRIMWDLVRRADVLVQNLRTGILERMGFGYEAVRVENPRIVYCSMTAYGNVGPMRDFPGYDPLMQAFGGLMSVTGKPDDAPVRVGTSIMDMGMGMWGVIGILGALQNRERTGEGQLVEMSLYETALSWVPYQIMSYLGTGEVPKRHGSGTAMLAPYEAYPTRDGHILIAAGNNSLWGKLCQVLGLEKLPTDPRFVDNPNRVRNREALFEMLAERMSQDTTETWTERLWDAGVPCSPIRTMDQVVTEPQTEAVDILRPTAHPRIDGYTEVGIPVSWNGARPETRLVPPELGQDTRRILLEIGKSPEEIDGLLAEGAVADNQNSTSRDS